MMINIGPVTIIVRDDGHVTIIGCGEKKISMKRLRAFCDQLDLLIGSTEHPGNTRGTIPRALVEPLEPANIEGLSEDVDQWRRAALPELDKWLCKDHLANRGSTISEESNSAFVLGDVRRFLYREAGKGFWEYVAHQPLDLAMSHAFQLTEPAEGSTKF